MQADLTGFKCLRLTILIVREQCWKYNIVASMSSPINVQNAQNTAKHVPIQLCNLSCRQQALAYHISSNTID
jgi:hypothetical protein